MCFFYHAKNVFISYTADLIYLRFIKTKDVVKAFYLPNIIDTSNENE